MPITEINYKEALLAILAEIQEFEGGYTRLITLGVCLLIVAFLNRKDIGKVCLPIVLTIVLLLSPHLYTYLYQNTSYKRFFWTLPEVILFSYATILIVARLKNVWIKATCSLAMISLIVFSGNSIYLAEAGFYSKADNLEHLDPTIVELADTITGIDPNPTCVIPIQAAEMIRVAEPAIEQIAGRNYLGYMGQTDPVIAKLMSGVSYPTPDSDYIFSVSNSKSIKIVVTMSYVAIDDTIASLYGYVYYGTVGDYKIYYNPEPGSSTDEWYITQYGPDWGKNYCYTIEDKNGNLIIIDGGHNGNAELLKSIIRDHGYHVYAWIFTTLSDNHVGAAYDILREEADLLSIDNIYIQQYTSDMLDVIYNDQSDWEVQELEDAEGFVNTINQFDNVIYLEDGQDYDVLGLNLHVYHVWDEAVEAIGSLEAGNSSVVFSVTGNENSMLFTSYTTQPIESDVFEAIGETGFDYISVNAHGEWVYDYWWYDAMNSSGLFIDNETLQLNPEGNAFAFYSYALEKGYNIYTFYTVPNRITIR